MPDTHDPLRSLFHEAASAGQSASALPPVSAIERRGERVRRRRIAGLAVACCLVLGGSGAAVAALLPAEPSRPTLPATTPSPSPAPPTTAPPTPRSTTTTSASATSTTWPTAPTHTSMPTTTPPAAPPSTPMGNPTTTPTSTNGPR
ncbi:hypothetical protein [Streptomyces sp. NPDC047014]|uniref:hypothetical protein n=1 Tax=Streptomyces sp. NPDC047014 TaxID=3155736 RepID=UPI0033D66A2A